MTPTRFSLPVLGNTSSTGQAPVTTATLAPSGGAAIQVKGGYDKGYWRSIEEKITGKSASPHADREFPPGATEPPSGFARREFIQLAAASMALAGLNACTEKPVERVLPYTKTPDGLAPGIPLHFATAYSLSGDATGLVVTSWEGRPTKIEGNPEHPASLGATGLREQALSLQVYDPQRARGLKLRGAGKAWRSLRETLVARAALWDMDGGAKLRFLMEPSNSPFEASLRAQIQKRFPQAKFYGSSSVFRDNVYEGARLALGDALETHHDLSKADVIVSLDSDFLEAAPGKIMGARAFAQRRDPAAPAGLNRLYAIEPNLSITGGMADHRLRLKATEMEGFAMALLGYVATNAGGAAAHLSGTAADLARKVTLTSEQQRFLTAMAKDLITHAGRSVVVVGRRHTPLTHAIAHVINAALGNAGTTVRYTKSVQADLMTGPGALKPLVEEMLAGGVDTLLITAWNPVYTAPADLNFASALKNVEHSIYTGLYEDETAAVASWFVPQAHLLESWGDARAKDGTTSIIQPLISPLFNGLTQADLLAAFLNIPETRTYQLLKDFHSAEHKGLDFEAAWETWLSKGVIPDTALASVSPTVNFAAVTQAAASVTPLRPDSFELNIVPDYKLFDGRFANSTWLQEIPDPVTKIGWDNPALISPTSARELGVETGDVVRLGLGKAGVDAAIFVLPGHADKSITVALGYGREGAEEVAKGAGININPLRTAAAPWFTAGLSVTKSGRTFPLSTVQHHWSMEGRTIALSQTLEEFKRAPEAAEQRRALPTLHKPVDYSKETYRWGMAVDLSRCTGCTACVIACQAENNIPVVGKDQMNKGRAMHWIRTDRYFAGSDTDPEMVHQPVMCQHCETAPCEYVCPVAATVHSDEGLNDMVYNRCIGTRYCSNNCPYKVRHFNYFHWNADMTPYEQMAMNPDVTVRARGVMEKCTYCTQRIERTRIVARIEGRTIRETELKTACQQVCPTDAIVFGNLADAQSQVSLRHNNDRRYDLLHELNTRPRTAYLTRIKNPNPELASHV